MKSYLCKKISENIILDGNIDKPVWKQAMTAELLETETGAKPRMGTTAKALWSSDYLYIGFECEDDEEMNIQLRNYNQPLYLEDVVEVFIDDNRDLKTYIEIEVNPLNALLHYYIQNNLVGEIAGFARVNKNVETAVYKPEGKNNWSVEIAIPFSEFVTSKKTPPDSGDVWLVNFYRIDRRNPEEDEYSAWSPTGKIAFHMPEKFGELVFVD
jgi:hypothetical protein